MQEIDPDDRNQPGQLKIALDTI